ncbi:MAG: hypothetical protein ACOC45_08850, partial [Alkalispirochaetaceae bacterium]
MEHWNSNTMMVTGFRSISGVYRFIRATVHEAENGIEDGRLTFSSDAGTYTIDLEYVSATVTSLSHRLVLTYRFLSQGDVFTRLAAAISEEYPHLLMTHLVIGAKAGELRLRQIKGGKLLYDRTMPAVVGSAVVNELESEPFHGETLTFNLEDLIGLTESEFIEHLGQLKTPVFSDPSSS